MAQENSIIQLGNQENVEPIGNVSVINLPQNIPHNNGAILLETNQTLPSSNLTTSDKYYRHVQTTSSSLWNVRHNLNKRPSIHIEDSQGKEMIAEIIHINNNYIQVIFGGNYSGTAHCN